MSLSPGFDLFHYLRKADRCDHGDAEIQYTDAAVQSLLKSDDNYFLDMHSVAHYCQFFPDHICITLPAGNSMELNVILKIYIVKH